MARTSKRYLDEIVETETRSYLAGVYVRLSNERHETWREKSHSPKAQAYVCQSYAKENGIHVVQVYEDYEYSGTNFERPAYIQMMTDIKCGKINCIIVRDLSRLGREHIEMGRLIDKVFPFLGVRFISVLDKLDTCKDVDNNKSFEVMIKNIINDLYAKDISQKIISSKHQRAKDGYFIGSVPPYGYKIDKTPKGQKLLVDENTAPIVRMIFDLTLEGKSQYEVALELNKQKITTGMVYYKTGRMKREEDDPQWVVGTVSKILVNSVYTGTLSQGKKRQNLVKGEKQHLTKKEEWIVVPNSHEAIISEDEFNLVKTQRKERKESHVFSSKQHDFVRDRENRFKGLVFAKYSGMPMYRRTRIYGKNHDRLYYVFKTDDYTGIISDHERLFIMERTLEEMVLKAISDMATSLVSEKVLMERITKEYILQSEKFKSELKLQKATLKRTNSNIEKLYERYATGSLDKDKYLYEKELDNFKSEACLAEIAKLEEKLADLKSEKRKARKIARSIFENRTNTRLSYEVIHDLIERIDVVSKTMIDVLFTFDYSKKGGAIHE